MLSAEFIERTRGARKVVLVDLGFLGDAVHTVPACWELRRNYPDAELHTVFAPAGAEVMALAPCVDRSWAWPRTRSVRDWRAELGRLRALRRERFDVAVNFSGADRAVLLSGLLGARWRAGYPGDRRHFWTRWMIPCLTPRQTRDRHIAQRHRQTLADLGLQLGEFSYGLRVPPEEAAAAAVEVPGLAVHVSLNASGPLHEWPLESWIEFVSALLRRPGRLHVVATGADREREQARLRGLALGVSHPRLKVVPPGSVARLAALLCRCQAHVGADSGALHLATALGVPTVSFFRDYEGTVDWAPTGPCDRVLKRPCPCRVLRRVERVPACHGAGAARCLREIPPAEALAALDEVLAAGGGRAAPPVPAGRAPGL